MLGWGITLGASLSTSLTSTTSSNIMVSYLEVVFLQKIVIGIDLYNENSEKKMMPRIKNLGSEIIVR